MIEGANEEQTSLLEVNDKREWARTSAIMAQIHNAQCTKRSQLLDFSRFDPYAQKDGGRVTGGMLLTKDNFAAFAQLMTNGRQATFKPYQPLDPRERPGTIVRVLGETNDSN